MNSPLILTISKYFVALILASCVVLRLPGSAFADKLNGAQWTLIGWNNLGMHCLDADYSVLSLLPPYNTIQAQLVDPDGNLVTNGAGYTVTYEAIVDPSGSINTTSQGKVNFWDFVEDLFNVQLPADMGLAGSAMPGPSNTPQPMTFDSEHNWFIATGIPITPFDDALHVNAYPTMRLTARDSQGQVLAVTNIVLPASTEMNCLACHASGSVDAAQPPDGWVNDPDSERDYRLNVLRLHDAREGGTAEFTAALAEAGFNPAGLFATVNTNDKPILCARCHASEALAAGGVEGVRPLTSAVHSRHASVLNPQNGLPLDAANNRTACYQCHPGSTTRCLRGAMGKAVASDGSMLMQCQSCHGTMGQVGAPGRQGWLDEPNCQSCHTGTAMSNNGEIRYTSAFDPDTGQEREAVDQTFAVNAGMLYRFSIGHGGMQCAACHGSTHAEYPSAELNDNLQNMFVQGHEGVIAECTACHATMPNTANQGPHGMHTVGQDWVSRHGDQAEHGGLGQCGTCHGGDYRGTVLSRSFNSRVLSAFGTKNFWRGYQIGCYTCHNGPHNDDPTANHAPIVSNLAYTTQGAPITFALSGTDQDGTTLAYRIVSQPAHGTLALSSSLATYYPEQGFSGTDTFTFAASDGFLDSNLGVGTLNVLAVPNPTDSQYLLWNGFLGMSNIVEILNGSTETQTATLHILGSNGEETYQMPFTVDPSGQRDIPLNTLPGFALDSYGLARIDYSGDWLNGRTSYYRAVADGTYEFAFAVPFTAALQGQSSVAFNTFQPSLDWRENSDPVAQWLSIVNLSPTDSINFTVTTYLQDGTRLFARTYAVAPRQRLDIEAGHENPGPNRVGQHLISSSQHSTPYLAHLVRYGRDSETNSYAFALPLLAQAGSGQTQWVPISNGANGDNWVEVLNSSAAPADVTLEFYDNHGSLVHNEALRFPPYSQFHFHASQWLGEGVSGAAAIIPGATNDIINVESMFYFRQNTGGIMATYGSQGTTVTNAAHTGSYNLFLGMYNWLRVFNTLATAVDGTLTVTDQLGQQRQQAISLGAHSGMDLGLHEYTTYGTAPDTYGRIVVNGPFVAEVLRIKPTASGQIDFAMPTTVR